MDGDLDLGALRAAVQRAAAADSPVAVVELLGPGKAFLPSRGDAGQWFQPSELNVRVLSLFGTDALKAGLALYPPPGADDRRVVVVPLDKRNWLAWTARLEQALLDALAER